MSKTVGYRVDVYYISSIGFSYWDTKKEWNFVTREEAEFLVNHLLVVKRTRKLYRIVQVTEEVICER